MKYINLERVIKFSVLYRKFILISLFINIILTSIIYYLQYKYPFLPKSLNLSLLPTYINIIIILLRYIPFVFYILRNDEGLVIKEMIIKWFIVNKDGDISSDLSYNLYNNSNVPIKKCSFDKEGFYQEVNYKPNYYINKNKKIISPSSNKFRRKTMFYNTCVDTFIYENNFEINPCIEPHEELILHRRYDVSKSEMEAFSTEGTFAGLSIYHPTNKIVMYLFSPPHYKIILLNCFTGDENGNTLLQEIKRQLPPKTIDGGHGLCWRIIYPKKNCIYWFKYKIEKL